MHMSQLVDVTTKWRPETTIKTGRIPKGLKSRKTKKLKIQKMDREK